MQVLRIAAILLALYLILVTVVCFCQRSLLFFPNTIIPIEHAKALAGQIRGARFTAISGGHNEWSVNDEVKITR